MTPTVSPARESRYRKPRKRELIFAVTGIALLIFLGSWQVQRLIWKETLVAKLEEARASDVLTADELPNDLAAYDDLRFRFAELNGTFMHDQELHMAARYYNSQLGYHIFTPFILTDGRIALVNRGWVPTQQKDRETRPDTVSNTGPQTLKVMIRTQTDRNNFTPINQPDDNIWFGRDIEEMKTATALDLLPVSFDVIGEVQRDANNQPLYPIPSEGEIKMRNDHLGYAVTWYGIGIVGIFMFIAYLRKPAELPKEER